MLGSRLLTGIAALGLAATVAACSSTPSTETGGGSVASQPRSGLYKVGKPYQIKGTWYYPQIDYGYVEEGVASWYGPGFHGKTTANGEIYDQNDMTAAHRTLPLPSVVRVTNLENGRMIKLRVNDRGPFAQGRIIDLTRRGAQLLGFYNAGTAPVRVEIDAEESRQLAIALTGSDYPDGSAGTMVASRQPSPPPASNSSFATPPLEALPVAPVPAMPAPAPAEVEPTAASPVAMDAGPAPVVADVEPAPAFAVGQSPPLNSVGPEPVEPTATAPAPMPMYATPGPVIGQTQFSPSGRTYVQAGAFSQLANVQKARLQLARLGPVHVTNIGSPGRDLWRVRVGPLDSSDEAERLVAAVLRSGYPGSHVVSE